MSAALFIDANLHDLMRLRMMNLSLSTATVTHPPTVTSVPFSGFRYDDYDTAFKFGQVVI